MITDDMIRTTEEAMYVSLPECSSREVRSHYSACWTSMAMFAACVSVPFIASNTIVGVVAMCMLYFLHIISNNKGLDHGITAGVLIMRRRREEERMAHTLHMLEGE